MYKSVPIQIYTLLMVLSLALFQGLQVEHNGQWLMKNVTDTKVSEWYVEHQSPMFPGDTKST